MEVKYLGLILSEFLSWNTYYTLLKKKLNRAIGLLSKVQHFTSQHLLKTIYYFQFNSHLIYECQVWRQYQGTELKKKNRKIARESQQNYKVFTKQCSSL